MNLEKIIDKLTPEAAERIGLVMVGQRVPAKDEKPEPKGWRVPKFGQMLRVIGGRSGAPIGHVFKFESPSTICETGDNNQWSFAATTMHNGNTYFIKLDDLEPVE